MLKRETLEMMKWTVQIVIFAGAATAAAATAADAAAVAAASDSKI